MGCTHFPFFRSVFRKLFPQDTDIIDGSVGTVNYLRKILLEKNMIEQQGQGDIVFYSSGKKEEQDERYRNYLRFLENK